MGGDIVKIVKKTEIVITLALAIVLSGYMAFQNLQTTVQTQMSIAPTSLPESEFVETPTYVPTSEATQGGAAGSQANRVKDIRQTIVGILAKETFEPTVSSIHDSVEMYNGYVYTETLTYKEECWSGELVTRIPQEDATNFVFRIRELISNNGKVESITTSITDITDQIQEGEDAPNASIKITLSEVYEKPEPPSTVPILDQAFPVLLNIFTNISVGAIIGFPSFFALLGLAILIHRGLYPLILKMFGKQERG